MKLVDKKRTTLETEISLKLDLSGKDLEKNVINTEIGFLDHMLELFAYHSGVKL